MIASANEDLKTEAGELWQEAKELNLFFPEYSEAVNDNLLFETRHCFLIRKF